MGERQRVRLEFSGGLERDAGIGVAALGSFQDLRNVYKQRGRVHARRGMEHAVDLLDEDGNPCTHVIAYEAARVEQVGIAIGYQQATGKVYVYRISGDGSSAERLDCDDGSGTGQSQAYWFKLDVNADPPRVSAAEVYGKVFLAHDEPVVTTRAVTAYYDPTAAIPVQLLSYDLVQSDTSKAAPVKFRGVCRHLAYLVGWGFGTDADRDRPEFVRVSLPGQPTEFDPNGYFLVGTRNDPVLTCESCPAGLVAYKSDEAELIFGYSADTFGQRPLDTEFGVLSSRLVTSDGTNLFSWSRSGPRVTDGQGASVDLGIPLDLGGQDPVSLVAAAADSHGFAVYLAERKLILFVFGKRGYALSFTAPGEPPEWSYVKFGIELYCAGKMPGGVSVGAAVVQPVGYPSLRPTSEWDAGAISDFYATLKYDNHDPTPGSVCEVWLRQSGTAWPKTPYTSQVVDTGKISDTITLKNLQAGKTYDLALRYRSGGLFSEGYTGASPDDWTATTAAESKGSFTTTASRRKIISAVWARTDVAAEQITLRIDAGTPATSTQIEVAVKDPATGTYGAFTAIAGSPFADAGLPMNPSPVYSIPAANAEHWLKFRARADDGTNQGPWSLEKEVWAGPQQPLGNDGGNIDAAAIVGQAPMLSVYDIFREDPQSGQPTIVDDTVIGGIVAWVNATSTYETEVWLDLGDGSGYGLQGTAAAGQTRLDFTQTRVVGTLKCKLRHKATWSDGVTIDYSEYTNEASIEVRAV